MCAHMCPLKTLDLVAKNRHLDPFTDQMICKLIALHPLPRPLSLSHTHTHTHTHTPPTTPGSEEVKKRFLVKRDTRVEKYQVGARKQTDTGFWRKTLLREWQEVYFDGGLDVSLPPWPEPPQKVSGSFVCSFITKPNSFPSKTPSSPC